MYRKNDQGWIKHLDFMILDTICLCISYFIAYFLRNNTVIDSRVRLYKEILLILVLVSIVVSLFQDMYKDVLKRGFFIEFTYTFRQVAMVILIGTVYLFATKYAEEFSRIVLFITGLLYFISTYVTRIVWKRIIRRTRRIEGKRSLLIISTESFAEESIKNVRYNNYQSFKLAGICIIDKDMLGEEIKKVCVVSNLNSLIKYICKEWIDEVLIDLPDDVKLPEDIMTQLYQIGVVVHLKVAKESELTGRKQFVENLGEYTVLTTSMNYATPSQVIVKRLMDIAGGIIGCIVAGLAFIIIGPIIKIQSPGPIIFSQTRVGQNGKLFKLHKFRSMYIDAEERKKELMEKNKMKGHMFKMDDDPRITPIGKFIRKTSIDELPQFVDVLVGNMSLVGTRPPLIDEVKEYEPHHHARLAVKPGITGMWQVSGRSDITDFEEVVKLDTAYINNWSLGLDIRILFKTIGAVLKRSGSV